MTSSENTDWDHEKLIFCIKEMQSYVDTLYHFNAHSAYELARADALKYGIGFVEYNMGEMEIIGSNHE